MKKREPCLSKDKKNGECKDNKKGKEEAGIEDEGYGTLMTLTMAFILTIGTTIKSLRVSRAFTFATRASQSNRREDCLGFTPFLGRAEPPPSGLRQRASTRQAFTGASIERV